MRDGFMKKVILAAALLTSTSTVFAVVPGGPNCGWGNMLFKGQSGLPIHVVASTTNGTSGNATFGMTSGTNGCSPNGKLTYGGKPMINLSQIMDELSEDVAKGEGEALDAVAVMIGISPEDRLHFSKVAHANFSNIFPSESVTAEEVLLNINEVLKQDATLSKYAA